MTTLFTVQVSWFNKPALYEQLAFASGDDAILLLQDAVLAMQSPIALASFLAKCQRAHVKVYALEDDLKMRGVENQYDQITAIDYAGFVDLSLQHQKQIAW